MTPSYLLAATASKAMTFHTPHVDYLSILPLLIMMGGAVVLVSVSSLFRKVLGVGAGTLIASTTSVAALVAALFQWDHVRTHGAHVTIAGAIAFDGFDVFIQIVMAITMLLTALIGDGYLRREGVDGPEFHVLAMMSASGAMMMGAANDLIVIFLGLEILSIALYVLTAFNHRRAESGEGALKYFVLGAFSSAVFVYGIALVYGATGSTNLPQIADYLSRTVVASNGVLLAGLALLLIGFGFKMAAVPFHMWSPDVYQGAPSPATGFMAAAAKAGAFAAILRVFVSSFGTLRVDWQPIVWALAIVSLLVGAVIALWQSDVKRMMAYSSINHVGFILLGVQAATARGVSAALYYVFTYMFMVVGSFGVIAVVARRGDTGHQISDYRGLARRQPVLALAFAVLLVAQAGVPFTTGFLAKFEVVGAVIANHGYVLAVVAMVSAAIAAFFYLRVVIAMFSPVGPEGDVLAYGSAPAGLASATAAPAGMTSATAAPAGLASATAAPAGLASATAAPAGLASATAAPAGMTSSGGLPVDTVLVAGGAPAFGSAVSSLQALTDGAPAAVVADRGTVRIPSLTSVAVGVTVAFTVVFGIIPQPIVDFAHQATLLFM